MKTLIYKCDICGLEKTTEYHGSEMGNNLVNGLVGISKTDNRQGSYESLRNFKEMCLDCRKKAIKELTEFLIQNKYFY